MLFDMSLGLLLLISLQIVVCFVKYLSKSLPDDDKQPLFSALAAQQCIRKNGGVVLKGVSGKTNLVHVMILPCKPLEDILLMIADSQSLI